MAGTDEDLLRLMADLESDQVERKQSLANKDRIYEAICAFANDLPGHGTSGVVFVGVTDAGLASGLEVTDRLLLELADMRDQGKLLPPPIMHVRRLTVDGTSVAVIEVEPSPSPPVRFNGRVWIRVGPRRAIATADEERRLAERRRSHDLPFDSRPVQGSDLSELDLRLFEREYLPSVLPADVLEANSRSTVERLATLRLSSMEGTPTAAGLLILGQDPRRYLPGAYVQFLRVYGSELSAPIMDEKQLASPLPYLLRELDELLKLNIRTSIDVGTGLRDTRQSDYPIAALQQVSRNALLHRNYEGTNAPVRIIWYTDRVEMHSPGGPYGAVTIENFGRPGVTDYRNPILAEAMAALGYVQRFGAGLPIARKALLDNGNPPPDFYPDSAFVGITIRSAQ